MVPDITSPGNERIKWLVRLRERRHRDSEGVFIVEGDSLYRRALAAGMAPVITFVSDASLETVGETITVDPVALDRASYRQRSQDVIAVFGQLDTRLQQLDISSDPLVLIAEDVEKPGNLGAMLRTAAAAGADAVIAVGDQPDAHNPNTVRASTGALFTVPLASSGWEELAPWLRGQGIRIVAASPEAPVSMWDTDLTGSVAVVVGAEDRGMSRLTTDLADELVAIPQREAGVDSLNVSVAAAVLLFEARRQRSGSSYLR